MHIKDEFLSICNSLRIIGYKKMMKFTYRVKAYQKSKNLASVSQSDKKRIKEYWKEKAGVNVPIMEFKWFQSRGIELFPQLIPDEVWHSKIEPYFSDIQYVRGFTDKNSMERIIGQEHSPIAVIRCIRGELLDREYKPITNNEIASVCNKSEEYICKPSVDSGGGRNVYFLYGDEITPQKINNLKKIFKEDFIIQKVVMQHPVLKKFNQSSLNTLRVVSFLYKNKFYILSSFLRVGDVDSRVDNLSSGGYCLHVDDNGTIGNRKVWYDGTQQQSELDNIVSFPCWKEVVEVVERNHYKLSRFKIINWDIAVTETNEIIIVEYNLIDSSVSRHQILGGPILGNLTDEVLEEVFGKH